MSAAFIQLVDLVEAKLTPQEMLRFYELLRWASSTVDLDHVCTQRITAAKLAALRAGPPPVIPDHVPSPVDPVSITGVVVEEPDDYRNRRGSK